MSSIPTCPTCSSALIDKFNKAETHWFCPRRDRLTLMFVKEEKNFWTDYPDAELIGFERSKNSNSALSSHSA